MSGVSAYASPTTANLPSLPPVGSNGRPSTWVFPGTVCSSNDMLKGGSIGGGGGVGRKIRVKCNSSTRPGGSGSDDSDTKNVLDAFFLGKALAEALNERIESTVGEFLSTVGRLQAEQQKQVQDFQEEVFERAKKAKEKAAREAMQAQGLIPKTSTIKSSSVGNGVASTTSVSTTKAVTTADPSEASNTPAYTNDKDSNPAEDSVSGTSNDD